MTPPGFEIVVARINAAFGAAIRACEAIDGDYEDRLETRELLGVVQVELGAALDTLQQERPT